MESPRCGRAYSAGQMLSKCYPTGSLRRAHLDSTTVSGLAVRRNVGLGSPTNSQPGRLRYVAQASGLRVLAASSRQFWWYLQDAPVTGPNLRGASVLFGSTEKDRLDFSGART